MERLDVYQESEASAPMARESPSSKYLSLFEKNRQLNQSLWILLDCVTVAEFVFAPS